ncbi:MAG: type II/IV secretion system protein [Parcubacteria group bacterium]|nr:type II/IV secretion system protein [Parcubacteria group bacterium]
MVAKKEEEIKSAAKNAEPKTPKFLTKEELENVSENISIIRLVDSLVEYALKERASDIHIDPEEKRLRVRLRIDGDLKDALALPFEIHSEVITRIKVVSGLKTDEHNSAQDGRFKVTTDLGNIDVRVSIVPTYYGENAVMRILGEQGQGIGLKEIGYSDSDLEQINRAIQKPYGMILATGPTGSGKTTSLYAVLQLLNTPETSIVTIEDPIEYAVSGVRQIQVNSETGLTFSNGLRSILRQDPNIIMVGEIRDEETAGIAVNAALTGHLLLSTLHTNDAATTLPRLLDMGIEPFLIASTVNVAIGQRLVRVLCNACRVERKLTDIELKHLAAVSRPEFYQKGKFYQKQGCAECGNSGFRGRVGIHEILEIDDAIRNLIMKRANASEIKEAAVKKGMTTMLEDGLEKASRGLTTIEEILRVTQE